MDDGLALAHKAKLPEVVCDFIASHHGKSLTLYFYNVYCNNGGDPSNKAAFTYNGKLPRTKEQVVVMMADAVEADISLRDINLVKESFKRYLMQIYHARIAYPKRQQPSR